MSVNKVELAKEIAYKYHEGQVDKAGKPYFQHLEFVSSHVDTEDEKCIAWLHDLLEDTQYPKEKVLEQFGEEIYKAVLTMTHKKKEPYFDYIDRVKKNKLARAVKKADLTHNMMLDRLNTVTEKDLKRVEKYKKAYAVLSDSGNK